MANKSLNQRIADLSNEELVAVVLSAIESDPKVRRLFATLTASKRDRIAAIKGDISKFGHYGGRGRDHTAKQIASFIAGLVDRINQTCGDTPDEAFTLLCRVLATQPLVKLRGRQSFEPIHEVYDEVVTSALIQAAHRVRSAAILTNGLSGLLEVHHIRGVGVLFRHVGAEFPDETVDAILELVAVTSSNAPTVDDVNIADAYHALTGRILSATGRIEAFQRHVTVDGVIDAADRITLVEMHLDHEDFKGARQHLDTLTDFDFTLLSHANSALERYLRECPDLADREDLMRMLIVEHNSVQHIDEYQKLFGDEALASVMEQVKKRIQSGTYKVPPPASMLGVLAREGYSEEIAKYIERQDLNGVPLTDEDLEYVVELAKVLSLQGHPLAALLLLRPILWEMMDIGPNVYDAAAWLYMRIHELSLSVKDWGPHEKQKDFIINFRLKHGSKRAFWNKL